MPHRLRRRLRRPRPGLLVGVGRVGVSGLVVRLVLLERAGGNDSPGTGARTKDWGDEGLAVRSPIAAHSKPGTTGHVGDGRLRCLAVRHSGLEPRRRFSGRPCGLLDAEAPSRVRRSGEDCRTRGRETLLLNRCIYIRGEDSVEDDGMHG